MKHNFNRKLLAIILSLALLMNSGTAAFATASGANGADGAPIATKSQAVAEGGEQGNCTCLPVDSGRVTHGTGCPLYTPPEKPAQSECTCPPVDSGKVVHGKGCPLYIVPAITAADVLAMINALPTMDELGKVDTKADGFAAYLAQLRLDTAAARAAYNALTTEEKAVFDAAALAKLAALEKVLATMPVLMTGGNAITIKVNAIVTEYSGASLSEAVDAAILANVLTANAIEKLTITAGAVTADDWAWFVGDSLNSYKLHYLEHFTVENTVTSVAEIVNKTDNSTFPRGIVTVSIPIVEEIGRSAFYGCRNLESASFPAVKSIGAKAFVSCNELLTLGLPATPPKVPAGDVFADLTIKKLTYLNADGTPLTDADAAKTAYKAVDDGNTADNLWHGWLIDDTATDAITIEYSTDGINYTPANALNLKTAFAGVTLSTVTHLKVTAGDLTAQDWNWFAGKESGGSTNPVLTALTHFTVDNAVNSVADISSGSYEKSAFPQTIVSVTIPKAKTLGSYAFYNCKKLETVDLPDVTLVESNVFKLIDGEKIHIKLHKATEFGQDLFSQERNRFTQVTLEAPALEKLGKNALSNILSSSGLPSTLMFGAVPPVVTEGTSHTFTPTITLTQVKLVDGSCVLLEGEELKTAQDAYRNAEGESANRWYGLRIDKDIPIGLVFNYIAGKNSGSHQIEVFQDLFYFVDSDKIPQITKLQLQQATITTEDWTWFFAEDGPASQLAALTDFTISKKYVNINNVADIPNGTADKGLFPKTLVRAALPQVSAIGDYAFSGCDKFTTLVLGTTPPTVAANTFARCPDDRALELDTEPTSAALKAAQARYRAAPDGNTNDNLWYGWQIQDTDPSVSLAGGMPLESAIEAIGDPTAIKTLTITAGGFTTADWTYLKNNLTALTDFTIKAAVTSVADIPDLSAGSTFPTSIVNVTIPQALKIGDCAFNGCTALETLTIPEATSIGDSAVNGCTALKTLKLGATPPTTVGVDAFNGVPRPRSLTLVAADGTTPLADTALATALAAYTAITDGDITDNLWYNWQIDSTKEDPDYPNEAYNTLTLGDTYYFDLSKYNTSVSDSDGINSDLTYTPFIYAGTIGAYSLSGADGANTTSTTRSLFAATITIRKAVPWNTLNDLGLVFGAAFPAQGVSYKLRLPSGGSAQDSTTKKITPVNNEIDRIFENSPAYMPPNSGMANTGVWVQDTAATDSTRKVIRFPYTNSSTSFDRLDSVLPNVSNRVANWRPVLEIDSTTADSFKTVTLNMNGGKLNTLTTTMQVVYQGGSYTAPPSARGFKAPSNDKAFAGWNTQADGNGTTYKAGATVPNTVATLYALWLAPEAEWTVTGESTAAKGTLADGFAALATKGGSIKLLADVTNVALTINNSYTSAITLDLNGKNLTSKATEGAFTVSGNTGLLIIKGRGTVTGTKSPAMQVATDGKLVLEGGTYVGSGNEDEAIGSIYLVGNGVTLDNLNALCADGYLFDPAPTGISEGVVYTDKTVAVVPDTKAPIPQNVKAGGNRAKPTITWGAVAGTGATYDVYQYTITDGTWAVSGTKLTASPVSGISYTLSTALLALSATDSYGFAVVAHITDSAKPDPSGEGRSGAHLYVASVTAPGGTVDDTPTQEELDIVFGEGGATLDGNKIIIDADITFTGSVTIEKTPVTIDLNGHDITGGAGKTPIVVGGGVTVDIIGEGTISGGNAATGAGGNGITVGNGSKITIGNDVTVSGGDGAGANSGGHGINGGDSTTNVDVDGTVQGGNGGTGGSGGIGVYIPGTVEVGNGGSVTGGNGGNGTTGGGGSGGSGVLGTGGVTIEAGGTVTGGSGGDGTIGGNGNIGISSGGSITIDGSVQGGSGGTGSSGKGGEGGKGGNASGTGTITIGTGGSVTGGNGGTGATTGGNGGSGSNTNNGNTTVNGKTEGGDGGAGATGGTGGNGSTVTGSGTVDVGNNGTASGGAGGNGSTGNGGTGGSGTTTGGGNTTVNGGTSGGSGGGSTGTAGGNGGSGSISTGGSVTVGTGGNVAGGDGGDGTTSGGNGGNGTQTGGANSTVNDGTTAGGAGGSGSTGNGGTGGNGTTTDQGSITGGGNATGGNGGTSTGAAGGNGGDGSTSTGGGNVTVGGDSSGGSGGNGATTGGDGGDGITTSGNTEINGGGSASGGAGGTGTTGGGNGGDGSISGGDIIVDNGSTSGGNGGGSTGAAGGNGGDGSTSGGGNITIDNGSTSGGSGGNGATTGGTGGDGSTTTSSGTVEVNNGSTTGGNGGTGTAGTGGEGGNGAITDNGNITVGDGNTTGSVTGGTGGSGGTTGGAGGSGSTSTGTGSVDINTGSGAIGGNGGAGGSGKTEGGNGGDGSTSGGGNITIDNGSTSGGSGGNGATTGGTGGDGSTTTGSGTVDVNNGTTTGGAGGTGTFGTGGNGGNGVTTDNGNITVGDGSTTGTVTGGTGGSGGMTGGAGGSGSTSTGTGLVDINTGSGATGGNGGAGGSGTGGTGGSGTTTNTGDTTIDGGTSGGKDGTTAGGSGGNSTTGGGGNGGSGSTSTGGGDITVGGDTTGGSGGSGKTEGGDGGSGTTTGGNTTVNQGGNTSGGNGGNATGGGNNTTGNGGVGGNGSTSTGSGSTTVNGGATGGNGGNASGNGSGGNGGAGASQGSGTVGGSGIVNGGNGGNGSGTGDGGTGGAAVGGGASAGMGLTEKPGANGRKAITEVNYSQAGTKVTVPDQSTLTDAALTEAEKKDLDITEVKVVLNVKKENNPADKDKIDAVLSTVTADIIGAFFDITLDKIITKTSSGVQPSEKVENANAEIEITITIPTDMRGGSNYVVIRVHNGAGKALDTTQLGDDLTFKTDKFSTYAIAYTKSTTPPPPPSPENTGGGDSSSNNDEYDFWMTAKDKIQHADSGDVIKVSAKYYDKMPASVMSALYKSGVGMVITWSGGKTITIPAGKAQKAEGNRIYYPLSLLAELYQGIEFVETPAKDSANPETGGGYIAYADGKQIPITGGVTELAPPAIDSAPDTAPATITPPTAGFEADTFAGTPDAKAARDMGTAAIAGFAMLLAALCGGGVWFWKRRTQIEKQ